MKSLVFALFIAILQVSCTDKDFENLYGGPANTVIDSLQSKGTISVSSVFPLSAMAGDTLVIKGYGFTPNLGQNLKVIFGGNKEGVARIISESEIHVAVPDTCLKSKIRVFLDNYNFAYSPLSFEIIPLQITSFFPLSAPVGAIVTINGSGFKSGLKVFFNGNIEAPCTIENFNTITTIVPATGNVNGKITVWQSDKKSAISEVPFTFEAVPLTIASISPVKVRSGDKITITGTGFKPGEVNKVLFGSSKIEGVVTVYSSTQMMVTVPDGDVNGPITIWQRADRFFTSSTSLTQVLAPQITSLSDSIAAPNSTITVNGVDFSTANDVKILFGGIEGVIISASRTVIVVKVPTVAIKNARTTITVQNIADNQLSNSRNFKVWNPAKIFNDNFNRPNTDWDISTNPVSVISADWSTLKGKSQINSNIIVTQSDNQLIFKNPNAILGAGKKFNFQANLFINHPSAPAVFAGVMLNVQPDGKSYQLIRFNAAGLVQALYTTNDGVGWPGVFMSNNYSMPGQIWYRVTVSSEGSNIIHLSVNKQDGTPIIDTDITMSSTISGGKFGFWTFGDLGQYDNMSLMVE